MSEYITGNSEFMINQVVDEYISRPEFKRILLDIDISLTDRGTKILSVLSMFPREGKTFVIAALAMGSAKLLGKRVLIVDCVSHAKEDSFISTLLSGVRSEESTGLIDVVTAQSLTGVQAKQADFRLRPALATLAASYDRIFIDTGAVHASVEPEIDPVIIARQSEATIVVTSPYSLHRTAVMDLREQITASGVPVIGTIYSEAM